MSDPAQAFQKLLGRQATDKERENLYRVADALGIKNNDAIWLVLVALEHYRGLYEKFPAIIKAAARETFVETKSTAATQMQAAAAEAKADLAAAVARTAETIAKQTAGTRMVRWAAGATATVAVALTAVGWFGFSQGRQTGYVKGRGEGYQRGQDEASRASWANTPEGQLAYELAQAGSIRDLAGCRGRGWQPKDGVCYPHPDRGSVYGWRLPRAGGAVGKEKR